LFKRFQIALRFLIFFSKRKHRELTPNTLYFALEHPSTQINYITFQRLWIGKNICFTSANTTVNYFPVYQSCWLPKSVELQHYHRMNTTTCRVVCL